MRKAQLNAISRSYTQKAQKRAIQILAEIGVDFAEYCDIIGYKGSPVALCTSIAKQAKSTMANLDMYEDLKGER